MISFRGWRRLALGVAVLLPVLAGCGSSKDEEAAKADAPPAPVEDLYNNGVDALNARRFASATDQFNLVEQNYPYSSWAVNAQLMQGYAQYLQNRYTDAIGTLDRFIQLHPTHRDVAYAYYLRALSYYEQIADIQKVAGEAIDAIKGIGSIIGEVNEVATAIAAAVQEQGAATQEITRNVQQAAVGTQEVSRNIGTVNKSSEKAGEDANAVLAAADDLTGQAQSLRREVDQFLATVRAA